MTPAQIATLKTAIQADPALNFMLTEGNLSGLADALNAPVVPAFYVWRSTTPAADVFDAITWANFTPTDAPDSTVLYQNRLGICRIKQASLHVLFEGSQPISTGKANIRTTLKDALQKLPAGVAGAELDAGWLAVKAAATRQASVLEKVFAVGAGTTGVPATLVVEGPISYTELIGM